MHGLNEAKVLSPDTQRAFSIRTSPHITGNTQAIFSLNSKHSNVHNVYQDKKQNHCVQPMKIPFSLRKKEKATFRQNAFLVCRSFFVIFNPCLPYPYFGICIWYSDDCLLLSNLLCITFPFSFAFLFAFPSQAHILFWLLTQLLL